MWSSVLETDRSRVPSCRRVSEVRALVLGELLGDGFSVTLVERGTPEPLLSSGETRETVTGL